MTLKTESVQQSSRSDDTDLTTVAAIIFLRAKEGDLQMIFLILAGRLTADPVPRRRTDVNLSHSDAFLPRLDGNLRVQHLA